MIATAEIEAGICVFRTTVRVRSEDAQHVLFDVTTDCEKFADWARLQALGPADAFQEINPTRGSHMLETARASLSGCCAGCAMPVGLFKTTQVAAGLALPKDVHIAMTRE
jgi:hypothetical protein